MSSSKKTILLAGILFTFEHGLGHSYAPQQTAGLLPSCPCTTASASVMQGMKGVVLVLNNYDNVKAAQLSCLDIVVVVSARAPPRS